MRRFAILGATGHIGASLASLLARRADVSLALYGRRPDSVRALSAGLMSRAAITVHALDRHGPVDLSGCDVVVNALGVANPAAVAAAGNSIIGLTLDWEERVRAALSACPEALYVYLSSGAAYGPLIDGPARTDARVSFAANAALPGEAYGRAKLMAETMHRGWSHARVLDIRVFGFVSARISLTDGFFLSEMFSALTTGRQFRTGADDMVRDYVGPRELLELIDCAASRGPLNEAVDIYSRAPARKFELIAALRPLGLACEVSAAPSAPSARLQYFTTFDRAASFGYVPQRSACEVVVDAARELLAANLEVVA